MNGAEKLVYIMYTVVNSVGAMVIGVRPPVHTVPSVGREKTASRTVSNVGIRTGMKESVL